jgi:3-hydroxyisobutyrate dehydrogenase-like beta-hydroxyacid dehydrogenase
VAGGGLAPLRLGFVGLGNIGGPLCANLVADGHDVTAYDVDHARLDAAVRAGARAAGSVAEVAARSDCTLLSLPGPAVMESVAAEWVAALDAPLPAGGGAPRGLLIDLTTNAPSTVRAVGDRLAAAGARLVEAPVTGGAPGAQARKLVFIVGGDEADVAAVAPLLETIGRAWFHLGPLGCGNVGKLVNSLMAFTTMWVSLEGLALAAKSDIDLRTLLDMVRTSGGATSYLDRRVEEIGERGRPPQFALELAAKDAGLMLEVGRDTGVPLPVASALHQMLSYAKAQGLGGHDISDLVEVMERAANVKLHLRPPQD